jgi:hypothetical protein
MLVRFAGGLQIVNARRLMSGNFDSGGPDPADTRGQRAAGRADMMRSLPTKEESEREEQYQRARREALLCKLADAGAHWRVDATGQLQCKIGRRVLTKKTLSTDLLEDAVWAIALGVNDEDGAGRPARRTDMAAAKAY